jgi:hypothetical protein
MTDWLRMQNRAMNPHLDSGMLVELEAADTASWYCTVEFRIDMPTMLTEAESKAVKMRHAPSNATENLKDATAISKGDGSDSQRGIADKSEQVRSRAG